MSLSEMVLQKLQSVIALGTDQNDNGTSHAVNDVDIGGRSILHHAALVRFKDGDGRDAIADAVRTFLHLKGDPNLQDGQGQTALHLALKAKNMTVVQVLLEEWGAGKTLSSTAAATTGAPAPSSPLLPSALPIDFSVRDDFGRLPLHWASQWGILTFVHACAGKSLSHGPGDRLGGVSGSDGSNDNNDHTDNNNNNNNIDDSDESSHSKNNTETDTNTNTNTNSTSKSRDGNGNSCSSKHLPVSVDVNTPTNSGETALHWSAREGHLHCVQALIHTHNARVLLPLTVRGQSLLSVCANDELRAVIRLAQEKETERDRERKRERQAEHREGKGCVSGGASPAALPGDLHLAAEVDGEKKRILNNGSVCVMRGTLGGGSPPGTEGIVGSTDCARQKSNLPPKNGDGGRVKTMGVSVRGKRKVGLMKKQKKKKMVVKLRKKKPK